MKRGLITIALIAEAFLCLLAIGQITTWSGAAISSVLLAGYAFLTVYVCRQKKEKRESAEAAFMKKAKTLAVSYAVPIVFVLAGYLLLSVISPLFS